MSRSSRWTIARALGVLAARRDGPPAPARACPRGARAPGGRRRRRACRPPAGARPRRRPRRRAAGRRAPPRPRSGAVTCEPLAAARARGAWAARSPSTVTWPPSISRCAAAREPAWPARKTSSRSPAASAGTRQLRRHRPPRRARPRSRRGGRLLAAARRPLEHVDQREHAEGDRHVGDVEGREVRELDEVGHRARRARGRSGCRPRRRAAARSAATRARGRCAWRRRRRARAARARCRRTSSAPPSDRKPNAMPELRTWTRSSTPGTQVAPLAERQAVADERLGQLVERDDAPPPPRRPPAWCGPAHAGRTRSTTIPPTICRTMIATIGRQVERADPQRQPAEQVQPRARGVAQEVEHRVEPARVRHPHAHREDERQRRPTR